MLSWQRQNKNVHEYHFGKLIGIIYGIVLSNHRISLYVPHIQRIGYEYTYNQKFPAVMTSFQNLEILLRQIIDTSGFDGVIGLYVEDLQNGDVINFILNQGTEVTTPPDVAYTASSTIKIPIMVSAFRRIGDNLDVDTVRNLEDMISKAINSASDR